MDCVNTQQQMNVTTLCTDKFLHWVCTEVQYQIHQVIIGVQLTELQLRQPNLGQKPLGFSQ